VRAGLAALVVAAGCRQILGLSEITPGQSDGNPDAPRCLNGKLHQVCATAPPAMLVIDAAILTTSDVRCLPQYTDACVLAGVQVVVSHNAAAHGGLPLVIAAFDTIAVDAALDASSYQTPGDGAGAFPVMCTGGMAARPGSGGGGGGGAGGSFSALGGTGGLGGGTLTVSGGGPVPTAPLPTAVRAGCHGQNGAIGMDATAMALGGTAGGALYLLAGNAIAISSTGKVLACGSGGLSGPGASGAGGGGSGGMIALEAPMILIDGDVIADGGGGGAGGGPNPGGPGGAGCSGSRGAGGVVIGPSTGGNGGAGSMGGPGLPGANGMFPSPGLGGGGGGGGGGAGYVMVSAQLVTTAGGAQSPTPVRY
jgi:hypothetical protein